MSSVLKESNRFSVLYSTLVMYWHFLHCAAKRELNNSDYFLKSNTSLPSARTVGIAGTFLLFKNLLTMKQYVLEAMSGLCDLVLSVAICFSFA